MVVEGTGPDSGIGIIERAFVALGENDVAAFLALCSDAIVVRYPGRGAIAYGGEWHGRDGVTQFLDGHDEIEEILAFEPGSPVGSADRVIATGHFRSRSKTTGRLWETDFVHVFRVVDGLIVDWQAFFDTAAAVEAHRP